MNAFRDIQREMDDLSDEENELEDLVREAAMMYCHSLTRFQNMHVHNRGFGFLVPIGRSLTRQEEKNDVNNLALFAE